MALLVVLLCLLPITNIRLRNVTSSLPFPWTSFSSDWCKLLDCLYQRIVSEIVKVSVAWNNIKLDDDEINSIHVSLLYVFADRSHSLLFMFYYGALKLLCLSSVWNSRVKSTVMQWFIRWRRLKFFILQDNCRLGETLFYFILTFNAVKQSC